MRWSALACLALVALAGCSSAPPAAVAGPCTLAACVQRSDDLPGLELSVHHRGVDGDQVLEATARNLSPTAFWFLWVPGCGLEPWRDEMQGPSGPVVPHEPEGHCHPCGGDELGPGESLARSFGWDERVWDVGGRTSQGAPAGSYRWAVVFSAELAREDVCGGSRSLRVEVPVEVR